MKIAVSKKIPKKLRKVVRAAIEASHAYAPMNVEHIIVRPVRSKTYSGSASQFANHALIEINHTAEDMLDTIFHECFHIHQYSIGALKQLEKGFLWRGIYIPLWIYTPLHSIIPFEITAKAYAKKMCRRLAKCE